MKSINLIILLSFIFTTRAYASEDVQGWKDTYWGMSSQELMQKYGKEITVHKLEQGTAYEIEKYELYGKNFFINFNWSTNGLSGVRIIHNSNVYLSSIVEKLLTSLSFKYGKTTKTTNNSSTSLNDTYKWVYPTTIITLTDFRLYENNKNIYNSVSINYSPNEDEKL